MKTDERRVQPGDLIAKNATSTVPAGTSIRFTRDHDWIIDGSVEKYEDIGLVVSAENTQYWQALFLVTNTGLVWRYSMHCNLLSGWDP
jgi:hypothetical protein